MIPYSATVIQIAAIKQPKARAKTPNSQQRTRAVISIQWKEVKPASSNP